MTAPPACRQATGCKSVGYQCTACKCGLAPWSWHAFPLQYRESSAKYTEQKRAGRTMQVAKQWLARAKVSPKPWNWRKLHEIGYCYPVGENPTVQVPPDPGLASRSVANSTCQPSNGRTKLE